MGEPFGKGSPIPLLKLLGIGIGLCEHSAKVLVELFQKLD